MGWYRVTKKINGRFYDYWQRTYRVGKSVKTENRYIGPSLKGGFTTAPSGVSHEREPLYAGQFETPIGATSKIETGKPRNIRELKREKKNIMLATEFDPEAFNAVQDELDYAYAVNPTKRRNERRAQRPEALKL